MERKRGLPTGTCYPWHRRAPCDDFGPSPRSIPLPGRAASSQGAPPPLSSGPTRKAIPPHPPG
eukprot:10941436-Alexandrium_andersonii.AAC.1